MLIDGFLASLLVTLAAVGLASFCLTFAMIMKGDTEVESRIMVSTIVGTFWWLAFLPLQWERLVTSVFGSVSGLPGRAQTGPRT
jgi:hypothetical protein